MLKSNLLSSILKIVATMSLGIFTVAFLYIKSDKINNKKNGFERKFINDPVDSVSITEKNKDIIAVSGIFNGLFFFQTLSPEVYLVADKQLSNYQRFKLDIDKPVSRGFSTTMDSSLIYIMDGNGPFVITHELKTKKTTYYPIPKRHYTRSVPISTNSIIVRGTDPANYNNQIFLKNWLNEKSFIKEDNISEKNEDGGMSSDGLLHYDTLTKNVIYVSFYKNLFYCLDTNLNVVYTAHTIDTIKNPTVKAEVTKKGNITEYAFFSPSKIVNWESCVSRGLLFNNSKLRADNEKNKDFMNNSVIDIYSIKDGRYKGSFYIANYKGERMRRFKVFGDIIVALFDNYISVSKLNFTV